MQWYNGKMTTSVPAPVLPDLSFDAVGLRTLINHVESLMDKASQRKAVIHYAQKWAQTYPLGTKSDPALQWLRGAMVFLNTDDISNYIQYLSLGTSKEQRIKHWMGPGDKPHWSSLLRMMRTQFQPDVWAHVWNIRVANMGNASAAVCAGLYACLYDQEMESWWKTNVNPEKSPWCNPAMFTGLADLPEIAKHKTFMALDRMKQKILQDAFAPALGVHDTWTLVTTLYDQTWFGMTHPQREGVWTQLRGNGPKERKQRELVQKLAPMDLTPEGLF